MKCLQNRFGNEVVNYLVGYTDGCPDQNKSRINALVVGEFCDKNDLEEYIHVFAPTASFRQMSMHLVVIPNLTSLLERGERHFDVQQQRMSTANASQCHSRVHQHVN